MKLIQHGEVETKLQVSALIDVVFLLLIYFMVTATLVRRERDIAFQLPKKDGHPANIPVEALVEIRADGSVALDGIRLAGSDADMKAFVTRLSTLNQLAASQQSDFYVNILPHWQTPHYRVISVMDACANAGVKRLGFSKSL
jgi:biopolymer transport protein ExbD